MNENQALHIVRNAYGFSEQSVRLARHIIGDYVEILERERRWQTDSLKRIAAQSEQLSDGVVMMTMSRASELACGTLDRCGIRDYVVLEADL